MDIIAEHELSALFPDGRTGLVHLRVGRPRPCPTGEWACPVEVTGLPGWQGSHDIAGVSSLQSLSLGLRFLRSALLNATARGTGFRFPDCEEIVGVEVLI